KQPSSSWTRALLVVVPAPLAAALAVPEQLSRRQARYSLGDAVSSRSTHYPRGQRPRRPRPIFAGVGRKYDGRGPNRCRIGRSDDVQPLVGERDAADARGHGRLEESLPPTLYGFAGTKPSAKAARQRARGRGHPWKPNAGVLL